MQQCVGEGQLIWVIMRLGRERRKPFAPSLTISLLDQICHSPHYQPYNSQKVSSENLELDQLIISKLIFFFIVFTYLVDIVLIL